MQLHIVPGDELPIYRQIMRQVQDALAGGRLATGDKLPSQRDLAEELVISPLTVKKAYDELEREGVIETQRGRGTFVKARSGDVDPAEQKERLAATVRRLLTQAHLTGVALEDVVALVREIHREIENARARNRADQP